MSEPWDPFSHQYPLRALTQRLRALPVGHSIRLPDGTLVKSVPMKWGATHTRRWAVSPQGRSPLPRGASRANSHGSAQEAAQAALGQRGKR